MRGRKKLLCIENIILIFKFFHDFHFDFETGFALGVPLESLTVIDFNNVFGVTIGVCCGDFEVLREFAAERHVILRPRVLVDLVSSLIH